MIIALLRFTNFAGRRGGLAALNPCTNVQWMNEKKTKFSVFGLLIKEIAYSKKLFRSRILSIFRN